MERLERSFQAQSEAHSIEEAFQRELFNTPYISIPTPHQRLPKDFQTCHLWGNGWKFAHVGILVWHQNGVMASLFNFTEKNKKSIFQKVIEEYLLQTIAVQSCPFKALWHLTGEKPVTEHRLAWMVKFLPSNPHQERCVKRVPNKCFLERGELPDCSRRHHVLQYLSDFQSAKTWKNFECSFSWRLLCYFLPLYPTHVYLHKKMKILRVSL